MIPGGDTRDQGPPVCARLLELSSWKCPMALWENSKEKLTGEKKILIYKHLQVGLNKDCPEPASSHVCSLTELPRLPQGTTEKPKLGWTQSVGHDGAFLSWSPHSPEMWEIAQVPQGPCVPVPGSLVCLCLSAPAVSQTQEFPPHWYRVTTEPTHGALVSPGPGCALSVHLKGPLCPI